MTNRDGPTIYLLANLLQTVQMFVGFANAVRQLRRRIRIVLIFTDHPRNREVNFGDLSSRFDEVVWVGFCNYPSTQSVRQWVEDWGQID